MMKAKSSQLLLAAVIGSIIEWYDFALVGSLAHILPGLFFPDDSELIALLKMFSIFATGFLARPLGAVILGNMGDKYGRKNTLALSLMIISLATLMMSLLPTYQTVGIFSPLMLVILRLAQGFGAGGEHAGAILLLYESSSKKNRIAKTSFSVLAIMTGMFLGFAISSLLISLVGNEVLLNGIWRIPFLIGGLLGAFGLYIRFKLSTPEYDRGRDQLKLIKYTSFPIKSLLQNNKANLLLAIGLYWHSVVIFYAAYFYLPAYIAQTNSQLAGSVMVIRTMVMMIFLAAFFVTSRLSDRLGSLNLMRSGAIGALILSIPLIVSTHSHSLSFFTIGLTIFTLLNVIYLVPVAAVLSHLFPANVRYSGVSIAINLTSAIFGGTAPAIMVMITHLTGNDSYASGYLVLATLVASVCLYSNRMNQLEQQEDFSSITHDKVVEHYGKKH